MTENHSPDPSRRILELLEALVKMRLAELISKEITKPNERLLYELTGMATTKEIVSKTGLSAGKISGLWNKWYADGILTKKGKTYYKFFETAKSDE